MGRTLEHADALAVQFDRIEHNINMAARLKSRERRARRRAREARAQEMAAKAGAHENKAASQLQSRRVRGRGGVGASVGGGDKRRPQSAHVREGRRKWGGVGLPHRRALQSVITQRISMNPAGVADGLHAGFEQDQGRWHGVGDKVERHGRFAKSRVGNKKSTAVKK